MIPIRFTVGISQLMCQAQRMLLSSFPWPVLGLSPALSSRSWFTLDPQDSGPASPCPGSPLGHLPSFPWPSLATFSIYHMCTRWYRERHHVSVSLFHTRLWTPGPGPTSYLPLPLALVHCLKTAAAALGWQLLMTEKYTHCNPPNHFPTTGYLNCPPFVLAVSIYVAVTSIFVLLISIFSESF